MLESGVGLLAASSLDGAALVLGGIALLFIGGEFLVKASIALATRFQLEPVTIGLTVVAAATSLPELVVSLIAQQTGSTDLVIGNILGSNIFNIAAVLGIGSLIIPLPSSPMIRRFQLPVLLAATLLLPGFLFLQVETGATEEIPRWLGAVLLVSLVIILRQTLSWSRRKSEREVATQIEKEIGEQPPYQSLAPTLLLLVIGSAGLWYGGTLLVDGALVIVAALGVEEGVIGLTIVAAGTGAPELFATIASLRHGVAGLALGNIVGSNLFNLLAIFGSAALISPIPFPLEEWHINLAIHAVATLAMLVLISGRINHRVLGVFFCLGYVFYLIYLSAST